MYDRKYESKYLVIVEVSIDHMKLELDSSCFGLLYVLNIRIVHLYHCHPLILAEL